jgi:hypothetical protein
VLAAPESQGDWKRLDNKELNQRMEKAETAIRQLSDDIESIVTAAYQHRSPRAVVTLVGINGDLDGSASLETLVRGMLNGAGVDDFDSFDPGAAQGLLRCGSPPGEAGQFVVCAWVGNQRQVMTQWLGRLEAEEAARLTVELRDLAAAG